MRPEDVALLFCVAMLETPSREGAIGVSALHGRRSRPALFPYDLNWQVERSMLPAGGTAHEPALPLGIPASGQERPRAARATVRPRKPHRRQ